MYCCVGIRNLVSLAGERGIAVLARREANGDIGFVLQSRGLAFEDETKSLPIQDAVRINVACVVGLQYCPFCGHHLKELVGRFSKHFSELALVHKKFLASLPGM